MKNVGKTKARRTAILEYFIILPLALLTLTSKAHSCEFNGDYFISQDEKQVFRVMKGVPMLPANQLEKMLLATQKEIGNMIEFGNSSLENRLLIIENALFREHDANSRRELQRDLTIDQNEILKQKIAKLEQQYEECNTLLRQLLNKINSQK